MNPFFDFIKQNRKRRRNALTGIKPSLSGTGQAERAGGNYGKRDLETGKYALPFAGGNSECG